MDKTHTPQETDLFRGTDISTPETVDVEVVPEACKPPASQGFAPANFPVTQSEFERLTGVKRQTFGNHIKAIDTHLGRLGSCVDNQKRITEQGADWLQGYWDADNKAEYLDELRDRLQTDAMSGGSSLSITTAASQTMDAEITAERDRITAWNSDLEQQQKEAIRNLQIIAQAEAEAVRIGEIEQEASDRQMDLEILAELAKERQERAAKKASRKQELRAQLGLT